MERAYHISEKLGTKFELNEGKGVIISKVQDQVRSRNRMEEQFYEKVLIVDGNSLIHRAFYALPLLSNAQGNLPMPHMLYHHVYKNPC